LEYKDLEIQYHSKQREIFFADNVRFKVIAKGRRFGLTKGMINYALDRSLNGKGERILWIDTTYGNIQRYIQRYAMPLLKMMPKEMWNWNRTNNEIKTMTEKESTIDFRSADRPENIEGFGYNLVIINEAGIVLKNENLWLESVRPMMLDFKADAIIGGTPKGKRFKGKDHLFYKLAKKCDEVPSDLFPEATEIKANWKFYNYSSYDNSMLEKSEVDEYVSEISPTLRDQEVYGKFVDADTDRIIKREWFDVTSSLTLGTMKPFIVQSWDTAFKKKQENDYSVCTTWQVFRDRYQLINIFRERMEFPELKKKVIELNNEYNPNEIIIEDKASGISLIQELNRETKLPIKAIKVSSDKVSRVHSITPLIESGKVTLYTQMDDVNIFLNECEDFPNGEYDDMVDSMSQALEYLRMNPQISIPRPVTKRYVKKKLY
jgi:predicted phage terminase large subunit-like protein